MSGIAGANPLAYDYTAIDDYALAAQKEHEESLLSLTNYFLLGVKNDQEKARVIYRWMSDRIAYDASSYFANIDSLTEPTPNEVFQRRKGVCDSYAILFVELAENLGIQAVKVDGIGKGLSYSVGRRLETATNHSWNAVRIDGLWYLLDVTWGAGYIQDRQFVKHFKPFYFCTPPEQFINDHYPVDDAMQLLSPPISKEAFEQMVFLQPAYYLDSLKLVSHKEGVIETDGRLVIRLLVPPTVLVSARLEHNGKIVGEQFVFLQRRDNILDVLVNPPLPGEQVLKIFSKRKSAPKDAPYDWALDYCLRVFTGTGKDAVYPKLFGDYTTSGAYLFEPLTGILKANKSYNFRIDVPGADEVVVVHGNRWFRLFRKDNLWEGSLTIPAQDITIYAKFAGEVEHSSLISYRVK